MATIKKSLPVALKLLFSLSLVLWLLRQNKLDFSLVAESLRQGPQWLFCIILIVIQYLGSAVRWKLLLQTKSSLSLPLGPTVGITWIGLFFNSFLPGSVTGDVIKVFYAKKLDPQLEKSFLLSSIFMDRFVGLLGLLTILGASCLIFYRPILALGPDMAQLLLINGIILGLSLLAVLLIFVPANIQRPILKAVNAIPLLGEKFSALFLQIWLMGENKKVLLQTFGLSIGLQFLNMLAFYTITAPFYDKAIPLFYAITFIPLGMISIAIPISPAGLGVGHVIFDKLFAYAEISGGASLFNLFFLATIAINTLGLVPYILNNKTK